MNPGRQPNTMNRFPSISINADRNRFSNVGIDNFGSGTINANQNQLSTVGITNTGRGDLSATGNHGSNVRINNHGRRLEDSSEGDSLDELEAPVIDLTL